MPDGDRLLDLLGVGFGPANLAVAIALQESAEAGARATDAHFLEARASQAWHPDMMLEGSLIQITVLKDLAMVNNPRSRFTFLNYLKERGRLFDFLNLRDLFPTRVEFNDYLGWVARHFASRVTYGQRVLSVRPGAPSEDGEITELQVRARDERNGDERVVRTRNLVLATGPIPVFPRGISPKPGGRALHSHYFLDRLRKDFGDKQRPYRFLVVGSGQSAAEIFDYLMVHYPEADVTAAIRRFSYKPVDESDFTNRIFFPEWVDFYHGLPTEKRHAFFDDLKDVNYAVVDHSLIKRIFRRLYDEKVQGLNRARVTPFQQLEEIHEDQDRVVARFVDVMSGERVTREADALILCTGYEWPKEHPLLDELAPYFISDPAEGYRIERDYRIAAREGFRPHVYLQGYCEASHGISETVLSLVPVRANDIRLSLESALREGKAASEALAVGATR